MSYEKDIAELQAIIADIQDERIGIDELAAKVKRAAALIKTCRKKLKTAESDVQQVIESLDEQGSADSAGPPV